MCGSGCAAEVRAAPGLSSLMRVTLRTRGPIWGPSAERTAMRTWIPALLAPFLLVLLAPQARAQIDPFKTLDERAIYAMGIQQSKQLKGLLFTREEFELYRRGLDDGFNNQTKIAFEQQVLNLRQFEQTRAEAARQHERAAAAAFLEHASAEDGAVRTPSGLVFTELAPGTGESAVLGDRAQVHYHGTLRDGTIFDSSINRGAPATVTVGEVLPCWTEALQRMRPGGRARLVCPPDLAYGDRGGGPLIRPGAVLIYEIELLAVQPAKR